MQLNLQVNFKYSRISRIQKEGKKGRKKERKKERKKKEKTERKTERQKYRHILNEGTNRG